MFEAPEEYGEAARDYFRQLAEEIRAEFSASLNDILKSEMANFQSQISQNLGANNFEGLFHGDFLTGTGDISDVIGAALRGALRAAVSDYLRTGSINTGHILNNASRSGSAVLGGKLSRSQQSAEMLAILGRRRNI